MSLLHERRLSRRQVSGIAVGGVAGLVLSRAPLAQESSPVASPATNGWTYTDVLGNTVTLPQRPVRIAANLATAAALWDLGIHAVAVFDWTASAYPDGDHIAWGSIDPAAVANIGDADGNLLPEDLILAEPDIILTLTYDPTDPTQTAGIVPDFADQIGEIAPVLVVTDMESTGLQLERLVALAESLGADLSAPEIVAARDVYEAKVSEFESTASEQSTLTSIFMDFDPEAIYVAGPGGVAELKYLDELGLNWANADSAEYDSFWETLSVEEALKYPADIIFNDVYSTFLTLEDLRAQPTLAVMPAVDAGQVGLWKRDFPVNYAGLTDFLETLLETLRPAVKVT